MEYQIGKEIERAISEINNCIGYYDEVSTIKLEDTIETLNCVRSLLRDLIDGSQQSELY